MRKRPVPAGSRAWKNRRMKSKLLLSLLLATVAGAASADAFIVPSEKGTTSDEAKLAASHKGGTCMYGDKAVQLGDTVIMAESNIVLVCASAPQGPVFYPLSAAGAAQVVKANGAALRQGDRFACSPSVPHPGVVIANTQLLTCAVDHDVKSKAISAPAILAGTKLVGSVQGHKVTWSRIISAVGDSIELDAKDGAFMASEVQSKTIPRTLTVHVMRDLAFN